MNTRAWTGCLTGLAFIVACAVGCEDGTALPNGGTGGSASIGTGGAGGAPSLSTGGAGGGGAGAGGTVTTSTGGSGAGGTGGTVTTSTGGSTAGGAGGTSTGGSGTGGGAAGAGGGNGGGGGQTALRDCEVADAALPIQVGIVFPVGMSAPLPTNPGDHPYDITGTLVGATRTGATVRIEVRTAGGDLWTVVVQPGDAATASWQAAATVAMSQPVSLHIRMRTRFQMANSTGFVLKDDRGLIMAADVGPFVAAIDAPDIAPATIGLGDPICKRVNVGSSDTFRAFAFVGTTTANVGLGADGEFTLGNRRYFARNGGAHVLVTTATDVETMSPWAFWLQP